MGVAMIVVKCTDRDREAMSALAAQAQRESGNYVEVRVKKPWGHEIERYRDESCSVTWLHLHTRQQTSLHAHREKTALVFIVGGLARLHTIGQQYELSQGEMVVIEKGAFHRIESLDQPLVLYEIESPPNKHDLYRLQDAYGRGQGYECVNSTP